MKIFVTLLIFSIVLFAEMSDQEELNAGSSISNPNRNAESSTPSSRKKLKNTLLRRNWKLSEAGMI
jgi:hypothetical protein